MASIASADLLIILSDIDGFYTSDPRKNKDATLIPLVTHLDADTFAAAGTKGTEFGTGGMTTKLHAAQICMEQNIAMVLLNGSRPDQLYDLFDGKSVGTLFQKTEQEECICQN